MLFILLPALCLLVEGQSNLENLQTSFQPVHAWCTPVNQSTIHTVYNKTLLSILLHGMATFQDIYMLQRATTELFFFLSFTITTADFSQFQGIWNQFEDRVPLQK